jgi:hypothetical protein
MDNSRFLTLRVRSRKHWPALAPRACTCFDQPADGPYPVVDQTGVSGVVDVRLDGGRIDPYLVRLQKPVFSRLAHQVFVQQRHMVAGIRIQTPADLAETAGMRDRLVPRDTAEPAPTDPVRH